MKVKLITKASDLVNHAYVMRPPEKKQKNKVWKASRLLNVWRFLEGGAPG